MHWYICAISGVKTSILVEKPLSPSIVRTKRLDAFFKKLLEEKKEINETRG